MAQALCMLARVSLVTSAARDAAKTRRVANEAEGGAEGRTAFPVDGIATGAGLGKEGPLSRLLDRD